MASKQLADIIVHCSDSDFGSAAEIRRWHLEKGWRDIGYHFVIGNGRPHPDLYIPSIDGSVEVGRTLDGDSFISENEVGAHALGYNDTSIGICLIGKTRFSERQFGTLFSLLHELRKRFSIENEAVLGHYETPLSHGKTCPNIDMSHVRYILSLMKGENAS